MCSDEATAEVSIWLKINGKFVIEYPSRQGGVLGFAWRNCVGFCEASADEAGEKKG